MLTYLLKFSQLKIKGNKRGQTRLKFLVSTPALGCFESLKKEFIFPMLTLPTPYKDNGIAYYFFKKQQPLRGA